MTGLVLDKCFLRGVSASDLRNLGSQFKLLMIETLFFEIATSPEEEFRSLLAKLPGDDAVRFVPHAGALFQHEIATVSPAHPVEYHVLPGSYRLNADFELTADHVAAIQAWQARVDDDVERYPQMARDIEAWPLGLVGLSEKERQAKCRELRTSMSPNDVCLIYRDIVSQLDVNFPDHSILDEQWILFRWTQAQIIGAFDFFESYGPRSASPNRKRLENHIHDLEYLTIAASVGALATRDMQLARNLRLIRPDAMIIS